MKTRLALSVALAAVMAAGFVSSTSAEIVYGSLGPSGTDAFDTGNTAIVGSSVTGSSGNRYAVAFTTGTDTNFLSLQSVTMAFSDVEPFTTAIMNVVQDNAGLPTGALVTSSSVLVQAQGLYTFAVGGVSLSQSTTYWVTVEAEDATLPSQFNWLRTADPFPELGPQNAAGYSRPSTFVLRSQNGGAWNNFNSQGSTLAMSVQAVPEPSTYALAAVGLGLAGLMRARRRKVVS